MSRSQGDTPGSGADDAEAGFLLGDAGASPASATVAMPLAAPFDAEAALGNLRAHAISGAEIVGDAEHTRLVPTPHGPRVVTVAFAADAVAVTIADPRPHIVPAVVDTVRRWLDLDRDPATVVSALGSDPIVGELVRARPGLRVIGAIDPFETAVSAVLGQQVSLAAARTFAGRLVAAFGTPGPGGLTVFPAAEALAVAGADGIRRAVGLTGARARTVHALASAASAGELPGISDGLPWREGVAPVGAGEFRGALLALPGIGPWTADYLAVRVLGDRDAFVPGDLVLRKALTARLSLAARASGSARAALSARAARDQLGPVSPGPMLSARDAEAISQSWRPLRAYALLHLWTGAAYSP